MCSEAYILPMKSGSYRARHCMNNLLNIVLSQHPQSKYGEAKCDEGIEAFYLPYPLDPIFQCK